MGECTGNAISFCGNIYLSFVAIPLLSKHELWSGLTRDGVPTLCSKYKCDGKRMLRTSLARPSRRGVVDMTLLTSVCAH